MTSCEWHGSGIEEKGIDARPTEVDILVGDPSKAHKRLGWRYKTSFDDMVKEMVAADLAAVRWQTERKSRHD